ncbi:MAG: hypothetical protein BGN97_05400 [Microbacterium sp. 69-10]|nr:MAG: hypothetical protein BGN97_05400 [Microbacterium sp. 69-10]
MHAECAGAERATDHMHCTTAADRKRPHRQRLIRKIFDDVAPLRMSIRGESDPDQQLANGAAHSVAGFANRWSIGRELHFGLEQD